MENQKQNETRILGVAPTSRGVGFAIIAGDNKLFDWGVKSVKSGAKNERSLFHVANLIEQYQPNILAIESFQSSRRSDRVIALLGEICQLASNDGLEVMELSRDTVMRAVNGMEGENKHALAECLASIFPNELSLHLPRKRRLWDSEPYQMDMFEAVGLAHCAFGKLKAASKTEISLETST